MNLNECSGTTRSSWSAVNSSTAGYWTLSGGTDMLCSGEYLVIIKEKTCIFFLNFGMSLSYIQRERTSLASESFT